MRNQCARCLFFAKSVDHPRCRECVRHNAIGIGDFYKPRTRQSSNYSDTFFAEPLPQPPRPKTKGPSMQYSDLIIDAKQQCRYAFAVVFNGAARHFPATGLTEKFKRESKQYVYLSLVPLSVGDLAVCLCSPLSGNFLSFGKVVEVLDIEEVRKNPKVRFTSADTGLIIGKLECGLFVGMLHAAETLSRLRKRLAKEVKEARARVNLEALLAASPSLSTLLQTYENAGGKLSDLVE